MQSNTQLMKRLRVFGLLALIVCHPLYAVSEQPPVKYNGAEVYKVTLHKPIQRPDISGQLRMWREAYMVRMKISDPAPAPGPAVNIFLGEEHIAEMGGWQEGIYFWVYDPTKLKALEGRRITYQFDRGKRFNIGTLELGNPKQFKHFTEAELYSR